MSVAKIILLGCFGRMGEATSKLAATMPNVEIVYGTDMVASQEPRSYPTSSSIGSCHTPADAVISFLPPGAADDLSAAIKYCIQKNIPLIICTTGLPQHINQEIANAAAHIAIMHSPNMSLGVNLLASIVQQAAKLLYNAHFDIEIVEKHHNKKIDAPSGTAVMLADTVNTALGGNMQIVSDRSQTQAVRSRNEIGMHAVRGGTIVGEHSIIFAGQDEVVEISHAALSRNVFAAGALEAAKFIAGKVPGMYTMQDLINEVANV